MVGKGAIAARRLEVQVLAGQDLIKQSVSEKLLGGIIHNSGRWNEMTRSIVSQLSGRLNGLKKLKNGDFKSKITVATGIIQSKIQYLLPLYGGAPKYLLEAIQVQQLKAARFVCGYGSYYWSTTKLLKTCGWLSVKQQEFYSTTLLAHKIATTQRPLNLHAAQGQIRYWANF